MLFVPERPAGPRARGPCAALRASGKKNVALSFFGKKPAPPRPAAGPGERAAEEAAPPPTELSGLDFSGSDHGRGLAYAAGLVEVQECGSGIGAAFEEAAVLYANGNDGEALALLETAVPGDGGAVGEGAWLMLLDLYRLGGHRQRFESRVLDYATRFERSPPPWEDLSPGAGKAKTGQAPLVNLSGNLSGAAEKQFQQIAAIARRSGGVRIDVSKVRGVNDPGCAVWRRLLADLASERIGVTLLNVQSLADVLGRRVAAGRAEERDTWLMLLELLQYSGDQARFEGIRGQLCGDFRGVTAFLGAARRGRARAQGGARRAVRRAGRPRRLRLRGGTDRRGQRDAQASGRIRRRPPDGQGQLQASAAGRFRLCRYLVQHPRHLAGSG